jgi:hypothetical protein
MHVLSVLLPLPLSSYDQHKEGGFATASDLQVLALFDRHPVVLRLLGLVVLDAKQHPLVVFFLKQMFLSLVLFWRSASLTARKADVLHANAGLAQDFIDLLLRVGALPVALARCSSLLDLIQPKDACQLLTKVVDYLWAHDISATARNHSPTIHAISLTTRLAFPTRQRPVISHQPTPDENTNKPETGDSSQQTAESKQILLDARKTRRARLGHLWDVREADVLSAYTFAASRIIHKDVTALGCFSAYLFPRVDGAAEGSGIQ